MHKLVLERLFQFSCCLRGCALDFPRRRSGSAVLLAGDGVLVASDGVPLAGDGVPTHTNDSPLFGAGEGRTPSMSIGTSSAKNSAESFCISDAARALTKREVCFRFRPLFMPDPGAQAGGTPRSATELAVANKPPATMLTSVNNARPGGDAWNAGTPSSAAEVAPYLSNVCFKEGATTANLWTDAFRSRTLAVIQKASGMA